MRFELRGGGGAFEAACWCMYIEIACSDSHRKKRRTRTRNAEERGNRRRVRE
jgi:hypothetical protein